MFQHDVLRQLLPPTLTYGWKYILIRNSVRIIALSTLVYCGYIMFPSRVEENSGPNSPLSYDTFLDPRTGQILDVAYKPILTSILDAKDRAARLVRQS